MLHSNNYSQCQRQNCFGILTGPLEQLMNQSLEDLPKVQPWFNRTLLKEMVTCGLGKENAAFFLPSFSSWVHFCRDTLMTR